MTKVKNLVIVFVVGIVLLLIPSITMAVTDTVTSEKVVTSTNGSVEYIFKGLDLEEGASYEWAIEKSQDANITNWYSVTAPEYSTGSIKVRVLATEPKHLTVLKSTDVAYITIRKVGETKNILENYKVDLTLPLLKAFTVTKSIFYDRNVESNPAFNIGYIYGLNSNNIEYKWEKITDSNIINGYIDKEHDLSSLNLKGKESFPSLTDTGWRTTNYSAGGIAILNRYLPEEDGLYYLWLKGSDNDVKTIYGQAILEVGEVTKINTNNNNNNNNNSNNNQNSQNQQTTNNSTTTGKNNNNGSTVENKTNDQDTTIATGSLPKAGLKIGLSISIILVTGVVIFAYLRYNKFRDIK